MLQIKDNAPEIKLPNQDGIEVSLSSFINTWVVIYFYPKDDTTGCTIQACDFSSNIKDFRELNATVIGISPDNEKSHQKFIEKYNLEFTLLCDEQKESLKAYDAWGIKKMYGKEYEGVLRSTYIINPDGKISAIWKNVKAKEHYIAVKQELENLQK